ncbi:MAG: hypothetical protein PCFJNLEI_02816 [Verrucomicrobiae bacterium]|nr:hypothetical protein [Verrucomicrobiae bacterium]
MLELNDRERDLLIRLLETARGETGTEIHHARDYKTRDSLREEREVVMRLLEQLSATTPVVR